MWSPSEKQDFNEELSLMVKNFNKYYKSRSKERSSKSRSYNDKRSSSREHNCYNCGRPGHYSNECTTPYIEEKVLPKEEVEEKNHHQEREGVEMIVMNEEPLGEARIRKGRTNHQRATQNEDIKLFSGAVAGEVSAWRYIFRSCNRIFLFLVLSLV